MHAYVPFTMFADEQPVTCRDCGSAIWTPGTQPRIYRDEAHNGAECLICPACGLTHYAQHGTFEARVPRGDIRRAGEGTEGAIEAVICESSITCYVVHRRNGSDLWHVTEIGQDRRSGIPMAEHPTFMEALADTLRRCDEEDSWMFRPDA